MASEFKIVPKHIHRLNIFVFTKRVNKRCMTSNSTTYIVSGVSINEICLYLHITAAMLKMIKYF